MIIAKNTPCTLFEIQVPIWSKKSVGLADYRLSTHNEVHINAKNKDGKKFYPDTYYISSKKARSFPVEVKSGFDLRIIPIQSLEILERT